MLDGAGGRGVTLEVSHAPRRLDGEHHLVRGRGRARDRARAGVRVRVRARGRVRDWGSP